MVSEFSSISELKSIREQKSRLSERERELSSPVLHDVSLIPEIYVWFKDILSANCCTPCVDSVLQRMKFIFIVLFLFSPSSLAGGKMPNGIREAISSLYPSLAPCVISNNKKSSIFFFELYRLYKSEIERIYEGIMRKLMETEEYCIQQIRGSEPRQLSLF